MDDITNLKKRQEILFDKVKEINIQLKEIDIKLNTYNKCGHCKKNFIKDNTRYLTFEELNDIAEKEQEFKDNDSCYSGFEEETLYCFNCIENLKSC